MRQVVLGAFALFALVLVAVSPLGQGASPSSQTTLLAPFVNTTFNARTFGHSDTGCSVSAINVPAFFYPKVGKAGVGISASSPACSNRTGKLQASDADLTTGFSGGVKFTAPTGLDTVVMNFALRWNQSWNLSLPNCTNLGTNAYFKCIVLADSYFSGYGVLNHSNPRATAKIPHLTSNATWSTSGVATNWEYLCSNSSSASCKLRTYGTFSGSNSGSMGFAWTFHGFLNASDRYLVSFAFDFTMETQSDHTRGGSMVGGSATASTTLSLRLNSIVIT